MTSEQLFSLLKSNSLHPIRIQSSPTRDGLTDLAMIGDIEEFINAAKALKETAVFVNVAVLEESDFVYMAAIDDEEDATDDEPIDDDDAEPGIMKTIDVATVVPEIQNYKRHLNEEGGFSLSILFQNFALKYYQAEKWWLEFQELRDSAIEKIEGEQYARQSELEEAEEQLEEDNRRREQVLVGKLRELTKNDEFMRLSMRKDSTQRVMQACVLEMMPELEELDPDILRAEIQQISDKVKSKRLLNK